MSDPFDLERFVQAQDAGAAYAGALAELRRGRKVGHWIWFVFPQVAGLGASAMSIRYAVSGLPEARAFLAHPVLGPRLAECCNALLALRTNDSVAVLGAVDAVKVRSSMTLFAHAAEAEAALPFETVLDVYYQGEEDSATLERL